MSVAWIDAAFKKQGSMQIRFECTCGAPFDTIFVIDSYASWMAAHEAINGWSIEHHKHGHIKEYDVKSGKLLAECL